MAGVGGEVAAAIVTVVRALLRTGEAARRLIGRVTPSRDGEDEY